MDIEITDERHGALGQYHLIVDGTEVGELDYRDGDGRRVFSHTGVRPAHEGRGLAAQLVRRGLDDAREEHLQVVPHCSYVAAYIAQHPEYADLLPRAD
ncbi:GNAT family N-acetyltransferase [Aquihabitans daechungensis]|uniref:GNAT family N-acetyltransferase n=1 Tax=Aquihabitans daechungensis TaxID=1052257 RepID=UPI003B9E76AF